MKLSGALRTLAVFEAAKGALVLLVGFDLLSLVHHDIQQAVEHLLAHTHLNPASRYPHIFIDLANQLTNTRLLLIAAGAGAYSLARFIEAMGSGVQGAGHNGLQPQAARFTCLLSFSNCMSVLPG
ncbi:Predicted membrane protein [Nitrosospira multiformis]|nr:Predicted membrane protein [Nitrosospira multiformis]